MIGGGNGLWGCGASGGECAGATFGEKQGSMVVAFASVHSCISFPVDMVGFALW